MENKEPNRDDAAEQDARSIEYAEKTEQLLKLHPQNKILAFDTTILVGIPTVYFLFVTTLAVIGTLAFYRQHHTTSEIFLYASVILVLVLMPLIPIGIFWYVLRAASLKKKPTQEATGKQSLWGRIWQSPVNQYFLRLTNRRAFRLLALAFNIGVISDVIVRFPSRPRFSLVLIVVYTVLVVCQIALEITGSLEKALRTELKEIWEFNKVVRDGLLMLVKHHDRFVDAQLDVNQKTLAAIVELNRFGLVAANIKEPDKLEGPKPEEHKETEPPIISNKDNPEEK